MIGTFDFFTKLGFVRDVCKNVPLASNTIYNFFC